MSATKKPRGDSKLKTLPAERQSAIAEYALGCTLAETVKWLKDDGLQTSAAALSEFLSWYGLQRRLERNNSTVDSLLEDLKRERPEITPEQLDVAGQMFFTKLAIAEEDSLAWKRAQDVKVKMGALDLGRQRFQRETVDLFFKWYADEAVKGIVASPASVAEKTDRLGRKLFGELWK
jgi:hypothetical protein